MKKRYQNEVAQAQRLASEASAEAERLRAEVKQRDTELVSLRLGIPSAAMLMMQTLEDQAVVEALAKAGGDLAGALGKAAKEVGEGGDISSAVAKAGGDVAGALRKAADGVRGTDGRGAYAPRPLCPGLISHPPWSMSPPLPLRFSAASGVHVWPGPPSRCR